MPLYRNLSRRRDFKEADELNLIPFMDLLISIIPFLMVSAVFTAVSVIETNAPSRKGSAQQSQSSIVVVVINRDNYSVAGSGPVMRNAQGPVTIQKKGENYDLQALNNLLNKYKGNDPLAQDVLILAQPSVRYSDIVDVMDAARITTGSGELLFPKAFFGGTI